VDTISARVRGDLTDAQWAVLRPLLPVGRKPGRPPKWTKRQLIDASRWRTRIGAPWREIPEGYGPWQSAYSLFRTWSRDGTWAATLTGLQARVDANGLICWDVPIDSTIARAHQLAAGARMRSADSSNTARWRPGTTNSPAATRPPSRRHQRLAMTTPRKRPKTRSVKKARQRAS
jgi:transposase